MALKQNEATIVWQGDLMDGSGRLNFKSGAITEQKMTFSIRTGESGGTTPEELIAGAHATCYAMSLSNALTQQGNAPETLDVSAVASLEKTDAGLKIDAIDLNVKGTVPGISADDFTRIARKAEQSCPVSNALRGNVQIRLNAQLV